MTTHEILVAAKSYLVNHGWTQQMACDPQGRVCAMGALNAAVDFDASDHCDPHREEKMALRNAASDVLAAVVGNYFVATWNDAEGRTFEEVIDAFDRAILDFAPSAPAPEPRVLALSNFHAPNDPTATNQKQKGA